MKYFTPLLLILYVSIGSANAQVQNVSNPYPRTITVTGSAEMEVVPDQLFVNIEIKEYQKKGETRIPLEKLRSDFLAYCAQAGIPDSCISIAKYNGADDYFWLRRKGKDQDLLRSITYEVKFSNAMDIDKLVDLLDDKATESFQLTEAKNSRETEYRKQLKIKAVQAAKHKAIYLAEAVNEKIGEAITINEPVEYSSGGLQTYQNFSLTSNTYADGVKTPQNKIDFRKIRYRYEVSVVYALK